MKLKNIELVGTKRETSISNNGRYPLFCHMVATDDMIFENFRTRHNQLPLTVLLFGRHKNYFYLLKEQAPKNFCYREDELFS